MAKPLSSTPKAVWPAGAQDVGAAALELKDHSHIAQMLAIGAPDASLSGPVLAFVGGGAR